MFLYFDQKSSGGRRITAPRCRAKDLFAKARAQGFTGRRLDGLYVYMDGPEGGGPTWTWSSEEVQSEQGRILDRECSAAP